jgi:hypothetical protein
MAKDLKYPRVDIDTGGHSPIGEDEPIFILRAQDKKSVKLLDSYLLLCQGSGCSGDHLEAIEENIKRFEDWQSQNPSAVKLPD